MDRGGRPAEPGHRCSLLALVGLTASLLALCGLGAARWSEACRSYEEEAETLEDLARSGTVERVGEPPDRPPALALRRWLGARCDACRHCATDAPEELRAKQTRAR